MADDGQEKTEEATPRKRQEARKKGTVAKSVDLVGALSLLTVTFLVPGVSKALGASLLRTFENGVANPPTDLNYSTILGYSGRIMAPSLAAAVPLILAVMVVGVVMNFAQVGFVFSLQPMNPTFDKLNPLNGFKRIFSMRSTVEGMKATFKMMLFGFIAYSCVSADWNKVVGMAWLPPEQGMAIAGSILQTIMMRVSLVWLAMAALDYFFQRHQIEKQLKMSRDELKREMKEQEGSPEVKAAQHRRRRQMAKGALAQRLKNADMVITNPTHYAVAIQYDRSKMHAPMVVAKGQDYLALKIREFATDLKVPIVPNPPLARALYRDCEVGDFVPRELFAPVAEVLAFVMKTVKGVRG